MMMKRIFSVLFVLVLLCGIPLNAYAHDVPQEREDCSIELIVQYKGKNLNSGTLTAIRVGYVDEDDGNYFFRRVIDDALLEESYILQTDSPAQLQEFYKENQKTYDFTKQTLKITDGKCTFENLSTGLYLIIQEKACAGYFKLKPFLVSVPYMDDGEYQYHLTANLKTELEQTPTTVPTEPKDPKLPQTGQLNWPVPLLAAAGLALFTLGWILRFGRRKENYEK